MGRTKSSRTNDHINICTDNIGIYLSYSGNLGSFSNPGDFVSNIFPSDFFQTFIPGDFVSNLYSG